MVAIPVVLPKANAVVDLPPRKPLDLAGAALITAATASAIYGLISAGTDGWGSAHVWVALAAALVLGFAFAIVERRVRDPLLNVEMFTRRPVVAGAMLMLTATGLLVGAFFLGSFSLQHAHHLSALSTGLFFLPTAIATIIGAHLAGQLLGRVSARLIAPAGFALAAAGYAAPALSDDAAMLVIGLGVAAAGLGALFVTAFTASLGDANPAEAGLRSAVVNTFHELGGAAGVAVLSTAAGTALVALRPVAEDFSHAFAVGAIAAMISGVVAAVLVPPVMRSADSGTPHH